MCNNTLEFWNQIRRWWNAVTGANFLVGVCDLIFGLPNENKDKIINQFNFLLLLARFHIYKNKQANNDKLQVYELLIEVKTKLEAMHHISLEQNREKKFEDSWSELYYGI
jgi:coproporphyrinogen III oxidase-like Fe-S oxidoreductase